MLKVTLVILICLFLNIQATHALDQQSKDAAGFVNDQVKSQVGSGEAVRDRFFGPLTQQNNPLKTIDHSKSGSAAALCGQGQIQNEKRAIEIMVLETSITVRTDTNDDGILDSTNTFSGISKVCIDGYRVGNNSWYRWSVSPSGVVSSVPSSELNGCLDPLAQPPTYAGGSISRMYAEATGKTIVNSSATGYTAFYNSGRVENCAGQNQDTSATKYYDNPYTMQDAAIQRRIACGASSTDPACQAYSGLSQGSQNFAGPGGGMVSCSIVRNIIDAKGPQNGIICEAGSLYYPTGFSETNTTCFIRPNSRWDYNSMFRARCDAFGKALQLEAWAYWEGAPCGTRGDHPPAIQIKRALTYGGSNPTPVEIGRFSVNRRMDGENTAGNDINADTRCVSDVNPMKVWLTHNCAPDNSYCTYNTTVDNVPGCSAFSIIVTPPVGENLNNQCSAYEQSNCKIVNEWYYDAQNNRVQTLQNGNPTNNTIEPTCKTYPTVGTVCKPWWKIERNYECRGSGNQNPQVNRVQPIVDSADNLNSDKVSYRRPSYNKDVTPTCIVQIDYSLEVYSDSYTNCQSRGGEMVCPKDHTYNATVNKCQHDPLCSQVDGFTFNPATDRCEKPNPPPCPCDAPPMCYQGSQYNSTTKRCEKDPICKRTEHIELECKYQAPANKTGLYCTINEHPLQQYERSRSIYRGCLEPQQCRVGCIIQIPDANARNGYRNETRDCNSIGNDQYTCPNGGYSIVKNCDCVMDAFDPEELKGEECEISCMVKKPATPEPNSNVRHDYYLKTCDKQTVNGQTTYTCPLATNETLYKDCGCPDGFGLAAGVLGALVEALNDRECQ